MTLNPTLMAMLACPSDDHAPLREQRRGDTETLVCTFCATSYPILDGIPVLLLDDATPGPNGVGVAAEPAPPVVPADTVVAAEPVQPEVASVAAEADVAAEPAPPPGPLTVDALAGRVPFDARSSPKHALPDPVPVEPEPATVEPEPATVEPEPAPTEASAAEPVVEVEAKPEPEVEPVAPSPPSPPSGPRSRTAVLRDRVQQRLTELEATRGPRGNRRGR